MNKPKLFIWVIFMLAAAIVVSQRIFKAGSEPNYTSWRSGDSPNILLIVTDDQRWDELGLVQKERGENARFPFLETPHLDALAMEGMRFRNAFVTTSLCSPSRSSILTGQYAHTHGVIDNVTHFPPSTTWATALREAGYVTAYFGKWHHGMQKTRPGFDYFATFQGQGKYYDTPFIMSDERKKNDTKGYVDERSVDFLVDYLNKPADKPFAIMLGLKGVHEPFIPMAEHKGAYSDREIVAAPNWADLSPWSSWGSLVGAPPAQPWHDPGWPAIMETMQGVDKNVGRILDKLAALDLANNTVVIFTSDNGYYLGEHFLGDKRSAYEESIRVPMLVRYPGVVPAGSVSDALVLNIDLAPTIIGVIGESIPVSIHGHSLQPLFSQDNTDWRDAFIYEHWQLPYDKGRWPDGDPALVGALDVLNTPTILAIRTQQHKLVTYRGEPDYTELFDLAADPFEKKNLANLHEFAELRSDLCGRLKNLAVEYDYSYSDPIEKWIADSEYPDKANSLYAEFDPESPASSKAAPEC